MNDKEYNDHVWEVSSIIKIIASMNINAICNVAHNIRNNFSVDDIDNINDNVIYEAYINQINQMNKENIGGSL